MQLCPSFSISMLALLASFGLVGLSACRPPEPKRPAVKNGEAQRLLFSIQEESTEEGDTITTREVWSLPDAGGDLRNLVVTYTRLGKSRTIFSCNNTNAFEVRLTYHLTAEPAADGSWKIVSARRQHTPGACDGELPDFSGTTLVLAGPKSPGQAYLLHGRAGKNRILWPHTPEGSWVYRRSTPTAAEEQKIELEMWTLRQGKDGVISGHYDRMELRESTNSSNFACNGRKEIVLFTRYTVTGSFLPNGQIRLRETGYETQGHHPCDRTGERYLDTYSGVLIGDSIRLKTRDDDVEQVLNRRHGL